MELKQYQEPITVDEQIANLKELGLIIDNEDFAKSFLNDVSYYRFVKAYSLGLKSKNSNYRDGITFEHLVQLYLFNANFRQILFAQIERVEINLRCRLSNEFSLKYGNFGYKDKSNFKNEDYYNSLMDDIKSEVKRGKTNSFVMNFQHNYDSGDIPLYALVELFSFGTLSKFYKNMNNVDKKSIAKLYGVGYTYFESWIEHISYVRNICAHYGRLYNINLTKTPKLYSQYSEIEITNIRVFATLICLKYLLPNDRYWKYFVDNIELLFEKYPKVKIELMGFPKDTWKDILIG